MSRTIFFIRPRLVSLLFMVSGAAALIYQIVWQRVLFTSFGVNIESVTIIVSIFMFGLGMGALVGGYLSKRYPTKLPHLFVGIEVTIGLFGIVSIPLIQEISFLTVQRSLFFLPFVIYGLLCLPTLAMGATLPILVSYLHSQSVTVGESVSQLYFMNTLGSALASLLTVTVLFTLLNLQTTVVLAALLNFLVAFLIYKLSRGIAPRTVTCR